MNRTATAASPRAPQASALSYRTFEAPVSGGTLQGGMWGTQGPVVLCSHGFSGNHMEFVALADQVGRECRLIAPDHRGRGHSTALGGPWGYGAHGEDLIAVLDHLKLPSADVVVGHSMGGFAALMAAARHRDRVGSVLMVDGGIPLLNVSWLLRWMPFRDKVVEALTLKIVGPSVRRLDMTFKNRAAFLEFWKAHPALKNDWSEYVERYVAYDLAGKEPNLRSSARKEPLLADARAQLVEDIVPAALASIHCPIRFLRAPRGVLNEAPLYDENKLQRATRQLRTFSSTTIEGTNHFTIMLSEHGAKAVAEEARKLWKADATGKVF